MEQEGFREGRGLKYKQAKRRLRRRRTVKHPQVARIGGANLSENEIASGLVGVTIASAQVEITSPNLLVVHHATTIGGRPYDRHPLAGIMAWIRRLAARSDHGTRMGLNERQGGEEIISGQQHPQTNLLSRMP
ncbi:unnamed protein product, partial [Scytosiphon promiscuus]